MINVDYEPSEWRCVFLFPSRPNSLFSKIQVWEWVEDFHEDDHLDMTTHDDHIERDLIGEI